MSFNKYGIDEYNPEYDYDRKCTNDQIRVLESLGIHVGHFDEGTGEWVEEGFLTGDEYGNPVFKSYTGGGQGD